MFLSTLDNDSASASFGSLKGSGAVPGTPSRAERKLQKSKSSRKILKALTQCLLPTGAHHRAAETDPSVVNVGLAVAAHPEPAAFLRPRDRPFHHATLRPQPAAVLLAPSRDPRLNARGPQAHPSVAAAIRPVGGKPPLRWSRDRPPRLPDSAGMASNMVSSMVTSDVFAAVATQAKGTPPESYDQVMLQSRTAPVHRTRSLPSSRPWAQARLVLIADTKPNTLRAPRSICRLPSPGFLRRPRLSPSSILRKRSRCRNPPIGRTATRPEPDTR